MAARQSTDVAIIGGGIAGCASAYYLAKKGLAVTLLEKGEIAGEQSGRNWGFVRQQLRDPLEIPLMIACARLWQGLEAELEADIEWRQGGILHLADTDVEMAKYEAWLEHARAYQLDSRKVSGAEAAALLPGMAHSWIGGIYTPSDGQADPVKTTSAFAKAAQRRGAEIRTGCIVEAIETAGGAVTGLRTEAGEIEAGTVLVAAGAWSARLLRTLGVDLPQLRVRSTVLRTRRAPAKTALGVWFRSSASASAGTAPSTSARGPRSTTTSGSTRCATPAPSGPPSGPRATTSTCIWGGIFSRTYGCISTGPGRWAARCAGTACSPRRRARRRCAGAWPGSAPCSPSSATSTSPPAGPA